MLASPSPTPTAPQQSGLWDDVPVTFRYTRAQAIEDGVLVSGNVGDLDEVTRQCFRYPVAMTYAVFEIMERAVANRRYGNDFKGVWYDILWMAKHHILGRTGSGPEFEFQVKITGAGRRSVYTLKMHIGPGDTPEPVMTIMLPEED